MDALYFPNLSLPSPAWTNPVALYFDQLGIIAPSQYEAALSGSHTAALIDAGLVRPMFAGVFGSYEDEDKHVLDSIDRWSANRLGKQGRSARLYRIHAGKLAHTSLIEALLQRQLFYLDPHDHDWLVGPEPVAVMIMTVLAERILRHGDADAIITNKTKALEVAAGRGVLGQAQREYDRRLQSVTRLLPVAPWVPPDKLARFKEDHSLELRNFRAFVEQLIRRNTDDDLFETRLAAAEGLRDELSNELRAIEACRGAPTLGLWVADVVAPLLEASFFSAAAGALRRLGSKATDRRRDREVRREGLAYAAMARSALRPRTSDEILA